MAVYAVLGSTSWGATLAWLLAGNGHRVSLLCRSAAEAEAVNEIRSVARMPGLRLPAAVEAATSLPADCAGLVAAVPAQSLRDTLSRLSGGRDLPILCAAKGIEALSMLRMSELTTLAGWAPGRIAVLSGPNLAAEVAAGLPSAAVVASPSEAMARLWQAALSGSAFRVYRSADVTGVEIAGAAKNVIAIAAGIATGLGFGANTLAALVTRGLAEITRLGLALGAERQTFLGLAGVGDLTATCFSPLSRNQQLGLALAVGTAPAAAMMTIGHTVEGVTTAPVVAALAAAHGVEMPITAAVCAVLAGAKTAREAMADLLGRELTREG